MSILHATEGGTGQFWCPGCNEQHAVQIGAGGWAWNGDVERPTLSPSVLLRSGHHIAPSASCWCTYNAEHPTEPAPFKCTRCHSFVRDGKIEFLGDCSHGLAGQTVPLPPWPGDREAAC